MRVGGVCRGDRGVVERQPQRRLFAAVLIKRGIGVGVEHVAGGVGRRQCRGDRAVGLPDSLYRGLPWVFSEGGPPLLGRLLAGGLVDEWWLTWSPLGVGGDANRTVVARSFLDPVPSAHLAHLLHADGVLLGRWILKN